MRGRANNPLERRRGRWAATAAARVNWLLRNRHRWAEWKGPDDARARDIVEAMRARRLWAPSTYWRDVRIDMLVRLAQARSVPAPASPGVEDLRARAFRAARSRAQYRKRRRAEKAARVDRLYNEHRTRRRAA